MNGIGQAGEVLDSSVHIRVLDENTAEVRSERVIVQVLQRVACDQLDTETLRASPEYSDGLGRDAAVHEECTFLAIRTCKCHDHAFGGSRCFIQEGRVGNVHGGQ